jgi:cytidylate kinase
MSRKKIIIAIDGHSSCGKSTLAKGLAAHLGYAYLDSGAMYRAVTLYFLENEIDYNDPEAVEKALSNINIHFEYSQAGNRTFLNDKEVEEQIRSMQVSAHVSQVAAIPIVRKAMVAQQRKMGRRKAIVMDGRDIGSVVFPDAELKIFLTASQEERTRRRFLELKAKGKDVGLEEVRDNLLLRDQIDSTRADSPLLKAPGAIVIDNTKLSQESQLQLAIELAEQKIFLA